MGNKLLNFWFFSRFELTKGSISTYKEILSTYSLGNNITFLFFNKFCLHFSVAGEKVSKLTICAYSLSELVSHFCIVFNPMFGVVPYFTIQIIK